MAGYVRVSRDDMRRLAKHLDISVADFEKRHVVERWVDAGSGSVLKSGCRSVTGSGYREVFLSGRIPSETLKLSRS